MADHQFEQKVSQQLADFKLKPNAEVWQQVEEQLQEDKRRRRWFIFLPIAALFVGGLLYAVWPDEKPAKTNVAVQQNNSTNKTTATHQNTESLTRTRSSTTSIEQPAVETTAGEQIISEKEKPTEIVVQQQPTKNIPEQRKQKNSSADGIAVVETKPKENNVAIVASKVDSVTKQKTIAENVARVEQTTGTVQQADTVSATEPVPTKTDALDSNNASLVVDTAAIVGSSSKPTITKRKWQAGLHVSTGLSDIRGSLFPGSGFKSFSFSDAFYSPGGINNGGQGGPTRIVRYEYAVTPSMHFSAGMLLRKPFKKRNAFVTGLQYQYSSYVVTQRQRIDTFILANNFFSNISTKEKAVQFRMHALNMPLEFEWRIADIKKGSLLLNAGIQNWFVVASTQTDTLSSFRYAATTERTAGYTASSTVKETEATTWQPQLYLSPAFEWKGKKASSQLGLYLDYGLRRAYQSSSKDYWWQTGIRYRIFFQTKK
jgi:hypothetical protein